MDPVADGSRLLGFCPAECSGHGSCNGALCSCNKLWFGEDCGTDFAHEVGIGWYAALVALCCAIHASVVLLTLRGMYNRWTRTPCSKWNSRDTSASLNLIACTLRGIWFMDPLGNSGTEAMTVTAGTLLRLAQAFWVSAFLLIILVWSEIVQLAVNARVSSRMKMLIVVAIVFLICLELPLSILDEIEIHKDPSSDAVDVLALIDDGVMALYLVSMTITGFIYARRLRDLVRILSSQTADIQTDRAERARTLVQRAYRSIIASCVLALILIIAVILKTTFNLEPYNKPQSFLAYMFFVHLVVEGGGAIAIYLTTRQIAVAAPTAPGKNDSPASLERGGSGGFHHQDGSGGHSADHYHPSHYPPHVLADGAHAPLMGYADAGGNDNGYIMNEQEQRRPLKAGAAGPPLREEHKTTTSVSLARRNYIP